MLISELEKPMQTPEAKSRIVFALAFGALVGGSLLSFTGCGAQLDPDVMEKTSLPSMQRKVIYMKISGSLESQSGDPIPGAKVQSQTLQGKWEDISTFDGKFRVEAIITEGEPIEFHFTPAKEKANPANVRWTVRVYDHELPKGTPRVNLHFVMDPNGQIRLGSVEY